MAEKRSNLIDVGRIAGVFGVKGWLKVDSHTEPKEGILDYSPWWLKTRHGVKEVVVDDHKLNNGNLIVHIKDVDDRDVAAAYNHVTIAVERQQLPQLERGEFYWHQLIGLDVISHFGGDLKNLGCVSRLMETGANDVVVVSPSDTSDKSIDQKERLIPYVPEMYVISIDLDAGEMNVDWDPDF